MRQSENGNEGEPQMEMQENCEGIFGHRERGEGNIGKENGDPSRSSEENTL